ncbi:MAG TPA: Maf family protein, partial [Bacillota bacterium]|nr:Maf family protein [Bacillota bacterium]
DAFSMLKSLSGKWHTVYTGYAVVNGEKVTTGCEETAVKFRELSDKEINDYIATGEPFDKAGAYGIQGRASVFVERIEGDFFNVVGLPICRISCLLDEN